MTGDRTPFETRLRSAVVAIRPTDAAPATLRDRVAAIPSRPARRFDRWTLGWFAAAGVTASLLLIALAGLRSGAGPGADGAAGASPLPTFDPMLEGPGILRGALTTLTLVPLAAGVIVAVLGMRWALRNGPWLAWRAPVVVAAALAVSAIALTPGFEYGSSYGSEIGYGLQVRPPPGPDDRATWYETAEPGGPLMIYVTLRNVAPVAIRVDGMVETQTAETPLISYWTALWLGDDPNAFGSPLEHLIPFTPQIVEPGDEIQIYVVGRAGMCAFGPGYTLDSPITGHTWREPALTFAYSLYGLQGTSKVELPMNLVEPYREHCS